LIDHIDDPYEKLVEKALKKKCLFPQKVEAIVESKEESKP